MLAQIGGVDVEVRAGTLTVEDGIDERAVCRLTVVDDGGTVQVARGRPLTVVDGVTTVFDGYIEEARTSALPGGVRLHEIDAIDHHYLVDKRIASVVYELQTVQAIVTDLHTRYLAAEGVTLGTVDAGPTVELIAFPYVPVSAALSELAELAGYWWYVTPAKVLEFRKRDAFAAPWTLTDDAEEVPYVPETALRSLAPDYRNVQYVRNVRDLTDPQTETMVGDGETRTFTVGFLIAKVPTVTVDGAAKTVGIRGVETGRDFYWSKDDRTITQDDSATKLTSANVLSVTYVGFFDAVVISHNQDAIADRLAVEGGTGRVEHVIEGARIEGRKPAFDLAAAKLQKYGTLGRTFEFMTRRDGLRPGMLLPVLFPPYSLDTDMLVVSVETFDLAGTELRYRVTAVEGPHEETWARFFARMYETPEVLTWKENISEDEVLTRLFEQDKTWDDTDVQPANFWYEVWPAAALATSTSLYPQIDRDQWMTYIEWWDDTAAVGRKQVTARTLSASEIESTFYLSPSDANIAVDTLKFYGGIGATGALQSGDLAVTVALNETKTTAEAWQITRTDTRAGTPPDWWEIGDVPA